MVFDTETNGIGSFRPPTQRLVQLAWIVDGKPKSYLIDDVEEISEGVPHDIKVEECKEKGHSFVKVIQEFFKDVKGCDILVCHNVDFDIGIIKNELRKRKKRVSKQEITTFCTMKATKDICKLPGAYEGSYKYPKLTELYKFLFEKEPDLKMHDALNDCIVTLECYTKLMSSSKFIFQQTNIE